MIQGPSGAGKSDLALRCLGLSASALDLTWPARLVADDQTLVTIGQNHVTVAPPPTLKGLMEVRGVGILSVPFIPEARLRLVIELQHDPGAVERLPAGDKTQMFGANAIPALVLAPFEASAPLKVLLALRQVCGTDPRA